jgi:hypothetical protein
MLTGPRPAAPPAGTAVPPFTTGQFIQAMHDFGEHWQLQQTGDDGMWIAIERPAPRELRVISAPTLSGLTDKLKTAQEKQAPAPDCQQIVNGPAQEHPTAVRPFS